jgi:hypothetical protein
MVMLVSFVYPFDDRAFLCGGDGTIGYVLLLGLYMDLLQHNLEMM